MHNSLNVFYSMSFWMHFDWTIAIFFRHSVVYLLLRLRSWFCSTAQFQGYFSMQCTLSAGCLNDSKVNRSCGYIVMPKLLSRTISIGCLCLYAVVCFYLGFFCQIWYFTLRLNFVILFSSVKLLLQSWSYIVKGKKRNPQVFSTFHCCYWPKILVFRQTFWLIEFF